MNPGRPTGDRPTCFIIMPFHPRFDRVYELVIAPACRQAGFEPERADSSRASERITDHLLARLIESEMVVGDLSSRNPNVLYELGVRHACGGSTVLVQSSGTERIFDIQDIRTTEYDPRLTPASVRRDRDTIAAQMTSTWERARAENLVYRTVGSLGFAGRQDEGYRTFLGRLHGADGQIRILASFVYFLNDQALIRNAFTRIARTGSDARILLLDPASAAAVQRGHDRPGKDVAGEIRCNLRNLADCLAAPGDTPHVECKVYASFPPFALFQCGGEATMIFYEYRKDLKETQSLTFSMKTPLGHYVSRVFEDLWKNADTCTALDDYLSVRTWFGRHLNGVRYLRGRECAAESGCRADLWLLLTPDQYSQVAEHIAAGEAVGVDDVAPGRYRVEQYPFDVVRRVAAQKYGEAVTDGLTTALAATRKKASASAGKA